jgi:hypothetical protein
MSEHDVELVNDTIVGPHDEPSSAVLLELGRLVWAAINLEDVVYPSAGRFNLATGRSMT